MLEGNLREKIIILFDWKFRMCSLALQIYRLLRNVQSRSDSLSVTQCYTVRRENIAFHDREKARILLLVLP